MADWFASLDVETLYWVNQAWASPGLDLVMSASSSPWLLGGGALPLLALLLRGGKRGSSGMALLQLAVVVALTDLFCYRVLKENISRARPCHRSDLAVRVVEGCGSPHGLPSNHAANSAAATVWCADQLRRRGTGRVVRIGLGLVPLLVGLSRIYLGVHFPSDVILGWVIGWGAGALTLRSWAWASGSRGL